MLSRNPVTVKPLSSGHHRNREKLSRYIEVNLEGFLRIGSKSVRYREVSAIERFDCISSLSSTSLPFLVVFHHKHTHLYLCEMYVYSR